uniref:Uncharacterized protein n=1 Tax=Ascaris lumbricoides TaxID=6252 RepID=A0A0M3IBY2_ASCLU
MAKSLQQYAACECHKPEMPMNVFATHFSMVDFHEDISAIFITCRSKIQQPNSRQTLKTPKNANNSKNELRCDLEKEFRCDLEKEFRCDLEKEFRCDSEKEFRCDLEKEFRCDSEKEFRCDLEKEFRCDLENGNDE